MPLSNCFWLVYLMLNVSLRCGSMLVTLITKKLHSVGCEVEVSNMRVWFTMISFEMRIYYDYFIDIMRILSFEMLSNNQLTFEKLFQFFMISFESVEFQGGQRICGNHPRVALCSLLQCRWRMVGSCLLYSMWSLLLSRRP